MCKCREIKANDAREFLRFSIDALSKLPSEEMIARVSVDSPADAMAIFYIRQGTMIIQQFADGFAIGQMSNDEVYALYTLLIQSEVMLGVAVQSAAGGKSCIGRCSDEKKECQANGDKQCGWNSFLCKINCFFSVKIDTSVP